MAGLGKGNDFETAEELDTTEGELPSLNPNVLFALPVAVKIPGSELALARRGGAQRTLIDFIGEVKDDYGVTIQNVRDKLDIKLSDETAAQLATRPIQYETGFTLLPGKYVIKLLARDAETGRMGTYQAAFLTTGAEQAVNRATVANPGLLDWYPRIRQSVPRYV